MHELDLRPFLPTPPKPDYEWALDALLAAVKELNAGSPEKALQVARQALWDPKRHPKLPTTN